MGRRPALFYKLYRHGFTILVDSGTSVEHLNAGAGGGGADQERTAFIYGAARYLLWWRTQYSCAATWRERWTCRAAYAGMVAVNLCGELISALMQCKWGILTNHLRGIRSARRFAHSPEGRGLPAF